jgi:Fe-S-cluster containining protein
VLVDSSDLARFRAAGREDLESTLVEGHFSLAALPTRGEGQCLYQGTDQSHTDCAIYEIRPGACRAFSKGSGECLNARQRGRRDR